MSDVLRAEWLIKKRGYFYRADKAGYTARLEDAGLYTEAVAKAEASIEPSVMSAHHISEFPTLRAALAPVTDEEVAGIRERHEALERLGELAHHDWASEAHTDRATLLRRDEQREAELGRLREVVEGLTDCQPVPKIYKYTGTAGVDVENMFDVGHRHKSGKQPRDYLMSWLSMFRPFAYATKDDSWGELEKLISIVMNNYVQILVRAETARAALEPKA